MLEWSDMIVCSLAVASVAWTITKSRVFEPLRQWMSARSEWWFDLFSCPYCMSHYLSVVIVLVVGYQPVKTPWTVINYGIAMAATLTLSAAFAGYLIRFPLAYSMKEAEKIEALGKALQRAKVVIRYLQSQEANDGD